MLVERRGPREKGGEGAGDVQVVIHRGGEIREHLLDPGGPRSGGRTGLRGGFVDGHHRGVQFFGEVAQGGDGAGGFVQARG